MRVCPGGCAIKWFKHISDSLDDPFIFELIDRFGGDGYLVFFGCLEILSREFDENSPGILSLNERFLIKKLQLSGKTLKKILNFCNEKERILVSINDTTITLNCPKLKDLCDEWTRKQIVKNPDKLRSKSGETPKKLLLEVEVEEDKEYKNIYTHWNDSGVVVHQKLTDAYRSAIRSVRKTYDDETIKAAITAYAEILKSPEHYFKHKWPLHEFLKRGLEKFVPAADPYNNFKTNGRPGHAKPDSREDRDMAELMRG